MQKDPQIYVLLLFVHININNIINLLFIVGFCGVSWVGRNGMDWYRMYLLTYMDGLNGRCVLFDSLVQDREIIGSERTLPKVLINLLHILRIYENFMCVCIYWVSWVTSVCQSLRFFGREFYLSSSAKQFHFRYPTHQIAKI